MSSSRLAAVSKMRIALKELAKPRFFKAEFIGFKAA
jgi:hypothetical protein